MMSSLPSLRRFWPFASAHKSRKYQPLIHTRSAFQPLPYGTKHFREDTKHTLQDKEVQGEHTHTLHTHTHTHTHAHTPIYLPVSNLACQHVLHTKWFGGMGGEKKKRKKKEKRSTVLPPILAAQICQM